MLGNENRSTKSRVLKLLREADKSVSGEALAAALKLSRTSVWKAIQGLEGAGYKIESQKSGYRLIEKNPDSILPFEFEDDENLFVHFKSVGSTMDEARKIALQGLEGGRPAEKIVTADGQSAGRGRGKHIWKTTNGSLAFTMVTRPKIETFQSGRLVMAAQIALANVLQKEAGRPFYARWPNDIWSGRGKVAGILDETFSSGGICSFVNLGIGVNISECPKLSGAGTAFPRAAPGERKKILSSFVKEFSEIKKVALEQSGGLQKMWNKLNFDSKKTVRLLDGGEFIFDGIDPNGWAILTSTNGGAKKKFSPGSVRYEKR